MYIRTKDGIYELTGKPNAISITNNVLYSCWDENGEDEIIIRDDEIIKQFDTIKELCDGFYIDDGSHNFLQEFIYEKWQYDGFTNALKEYNNLGKDYTGYGFIKTSKGLIYVAKMNEDGNLELL